MKKFTCILLSLLIFATPLFAIKEAIYNAQGVKVGYIEKVNGQTIYYDEWGNRTDRIDMQTLINQELDNIERRERAYDKANEEGKKGEAIGKQLEANYWANSGKVTYYSRCNYCKRTFNTKQTSEVCRPQCDEYRAVNKKFMTWVYIIVGGLLFLSIKHDHG